MDNLAVALATTKEWLISDEGLEAKQANPAGYANVKLYAKACDQLNKQAQFQQAVVTQAMAGKGPGADLHSNDQIQAPPATPPRDPNAQPNPSEQGGGE